jgi:ferric-dicitrate binding protein FerR (iron transport regulator)
MKAERAGPAAEYYHTKKKIMKENVIYILIKRFFDNDHPLQTCKSFYTWFAGGDDADGKDAALRRIWEELPETVELESLGELRRARLRIMRRRLRRWAAAAAVLLLLAGAGVYKYAGRAMGPSDTVWRQSFAAYGEAPLKVVLPDGSAVCLNAGSTLIYPDRWERGARRVFLSGEAHFDVARDPARRFIAATARLEVEALGTVFSIRDYPGGNEAVARLEEGSALVSEAEGGACVMLSPNEEAVYGAEAPALAKRPVDAAWMNSWREGYLIFQHARLEEIFAAFERKYNVRINFRDSKFSDMSFTVRFHPGESLAESLEVLRRVGAGFRYNIREKDVYIE